MESHSPEAGIGTAAACPEGTHNGLSGTDDASGNELTADERDILQALLENEDPTPLLKKRHLFLSLVVDAINEKLFNLVNDTLILFDGDTPVIPDEYRREAREALGQSAR